MDYGDILKRAWRVIWRYKVLWIFGLFAGAGGGGSGGGGSSGGGGGTGSGTSGSTAQPDWAQVLAWFERYAIVIALIGIALVVFALAMSVLAAVARGGLIHLVNEAEEGRPVKAADGWHVGAAKWMRVWVVGLLAALPGLLFALLVLGVVGAGVLTVIRSGNVATAGDSIIASLVGSACLVIVLAIPAAVVGVMLGISAELGVRYVVLEDRGPIESLKQGWRDLWARRGAFIMYLVLIGVGIAYGIVVAIVAAILIVPGVLFAIVGGWAVGAIMVGGAILVLMVPSAAYAAFYHAAWTIFFRKMTGMEPRAATAAPGPGSAFPMAPPPAAYPQAPYPPAPYPPAPTDFAPPAPAAPRAADA